MNERQCIGKQANFACLESRMEADLVVELFAKFKAFLCIRQVPASEANPPCDKLILFEILAHKLPVLDGTPHTAANPPHCATARTPEES